MACISDHTEITTEQWNTNMAMTTSLPEMTTQTSTTAINIMPASSTTIKGSNPIIKLYIDIN